MVDTLIDTLEADLEVLDDRLAELHRSPKLSTAERTRYVPAGATKFQRVRAHDAGAEAGGRPPAQASPSPRRKTKRRKSRRARAGSRQGGPRPLPRPEGTEACGGTECAGVEEKARSKDPLDREVTRRRGDDAKEEEEEVAVGAGSPRELDAERLLIRTPALSDPPSGPPKEGWARTGQATSLVQGALQLRRPMGLFDGPLIPIKLRPLYETRSFSVVVLGAPGAGKTATIASLCGLPRPDEPMAATPGLTHTSTSWPLLAGEKVTMCHITFVDVGAAASMAMGDRLRKVALDRLSGPDAAVLFVYSLRAPPSFKGVHKEVAALNDRDNVLKFLVGTGNDGYNITDETPLVAEENIREYHSSHPELHSYVTSNVSMQRSKHAELFLNDLCAHFLAL